MFLGRYEIPVKDGRFTLPRPLRLFGANRICAVGVRGSKFISLIDRKTLEKEAPTAILAVELLGEAAPDSRGRIRLGRKTMEKVFRYRRSLRMRSKFQNLRNQNVNFSA